MECTGEEKLVILFCGLPARGKSFLSRKLAKFLVWIGHDTKVFSIGQYRRELIKKSVDSKFFDNDNSENLRLRENCVYRIVDDMTNYLDLSHGKIGIIDGTNTRKSRRRMLEKYINHKFSASQNIKKFNLMWIESFIDAQNILSKLFTTKLVSDDYKDWDQEKALNDYKRRIEIFEKVYEPISDDNDPLGTYIRFINQGVEIETRNLCGYLPSTILSFLVNLQFSDRPIFMSRHGQSYFNELEKIGGDSSINQKGTFYAEKLKEFIMEYLQNDPIKNESNLIIYTSTLKRTIETSDPLVQLGFQRKIYKCLDEIDAGICDGMTYEEIKDKYPKDFEDRSKDKLRWRYNRGESYLDLIHRIKPIIYELERRKGPVLVIGHQATIRCLYGYYAGAPLNTIPNLDIPLNCLIKINPQIYGINEERYLLGENGSFIMNNKSVIKFADKLNNVPDNSVPLKDYNVEELEKQFSSNNIN